MFKPIKMIYLLLWTNSKKLFEKDVFFLLISFLIKWTEFDTLISNDKDEMMIKWWLKLYTKWWTICLIKLKTKKTSFK